MRWVERLRRLWLRRQWYRREVERFRKERVTGFNCDTQAPIEIFPPDNKNVLYSLSAEKVHHDVGVIEAFKHYCYYNYPLDGPDSGYFEEGGGI